MLCDVMPFHVNKAASMKILRLQVMMMMMMMNETE